MCKFCNCPHCMDGRCPECTAYRRAQEEAHTVLPWTGRLPKISATGDNTVNGDQTGSSKRKAAQPKVTRIRTGTHKGVQHKVHPERKRLTTKTSLSPPPTGKIVGRQRINSGGHAANTTLGDDTGAIAFDSTHTGGSSSVSAPADIIAQARADVEAAAHTPPTTNAARIPTQRLQQRG